MKKPLSILTILIAGLVLFASLVGSTGATTAGFNVDCTGTFGFGSVPEGDTYRWRIRYYDPPNNIDVTLRGEVKGPAAFTPAVYWPTTPSGGSGLNDTYYWIDIWSDVVGDDIYHAEGHFVCVTPTPTPTVTPTPPPGQGCTPGFWKNHLDAWGPTGYSPSQTVESVWDVPDGFGLDNDSLATALSYPGGSGTTAAARILLRAAVAAVLNAAHPDVNYPRSVGAVISDVNAALASNDRGTMLNLASALDADNNLGCPLR
ncbi:hypothetical protein [Thermoflexus sp.]|uniref:hypothetical protein n=1 Tax=Thermoflexus sp. TaxID=1969742 RepID=UPI0035E40EFB